MNIRDEIDKIDWLFSNETDEDRLVGTIERIIKELRQEWKANRKIFGEEDIVKLKDISVKLKAIKYFLSIINSKEYSHEHLHPQKTASELRELEKAIKGMVIEKKIFKLLKGIANPRGGTRNVKTGKQQTTQREVNFKSQSKAPTYLVCNQCGRQVYSHETKSAANDFVCMPCRVRKVDGIIRPTKINDIIARKIDEGFAGSREDNKRMRRWWLS